MNSRLDHIRDWASLSRAARYRAGAVAALCSISRRQLERFFREKFSLSPEAWLSELQLRDARELLARGNSVKVAAAETGFKDCSAFCRKFKRRYGASPLAAMAKLRLI
jgi:AraC-like DNA-binding protein